MSATSLIIDFFTPPRPTMDELKALTLEERYALADMIAAQRPDAQAGRG